MTVIKFKKIFAVILMLSVFLSGCQRQVITGVSKNENDVPTSTNTPAPWDNDDDDTWWDGHKFTNHINFKSSPLNCANCRRNVVRIILL
ncbi:hypothetical protein AGMMS5026_07270 [Endomicrobiia bacterium]|nr:hypothetical protein AGMMS49523_02500 [Endomicrobiia bacterium]GHT14362.1 hypothetical protein AGMMS49571_09860 [Endomicrobiia bacterium]GHT21403.1 hypothetical protein AGMMS49929_09870 [Endomicrobiia bacterium]GHT26527.1 hypothetical protein AGMMS49995_03390 [Endomicrobiia bacterium]GHT31245.1 hypothetical protein AGMMS5026_07270 [Endomicrobiia bacterium]